MTNLADHPRKQPELRRWVSVGFVFVFSALSMIAGIGMVSAQNPAPGIETDPTAEETRSITLHLQPDAQKQWQGLTVRLIQVRGPAGGGQGANRGGAEFSIAGETRNFRGWIPVLSSRFIDDYRVTLLSISPGAGTALVRVVDVAQTPRNQQTAEQGQPGAQGQPSATGPAIREPEPVMELQQGEEKVWKNFTLRLIQVADAQNLLRMRLPSPNKRAAQFTIDTLLESEHRTLIEGTSFTLGQYRISLEKVTALRGKTGAGTARFRITDLAPTSATLHAKQTPAPQTPAQITLRKESLLVTSTSQRN